MSTHGEGGKGSAPRPIPDPQKFRDNWDAIFGKKPKEEQKHENDSREKRRS